MRKVALVAALALAALLAVLAVRTLLAPGLEAPPPPASAFSLDDDMALATRLAEAVRIPTISRMKSDSDSEERDAAPFKDLHALLQKNYETVFARLAPEVVNDFSLLFTWKGSDPSLPPVVLLSHLDVVPISPGSEKDWEHAPFAGDIAGGFIWGRGTIDDKSGVTAILEAVRFLLSQGFQPKRTLILAFGHDEEIGGKGAQAIVARLAERKVQPAFVLDEGGVVGQGLVPGVEQPVAMVGISEKGYLSLELAVAGAPGHSSTPPKVTAIGRLARAVAKIEAAPFAARVDGAFERMILAVAPAMPLSRRVLMANLWLTRPLVASIIAANDTGSASVRTTIAPTIFRSGDKDNVLPAHARAVVNFRLLPGDSVLDVVGHVTSAVDDPEVKIAQIPGGKPASPVSDPDSPAFAQLSRTIRQVMPDVLAAPYLTIGATDGAHYAKLTPNVFRFLPARFLPEDVKRFHGTNERIGIKNYGEIVRFYAQLVQNTVGS